MSRATLRPGSRVSQAVESIHSTECPNAPYTCPCVQALKIGGSGMYHTIHRRGAVDVVRIRSSVSGPGYFADVRDVATGREFSGYVYVRDVVQS